MAFDYFKQNEEDDQNQQTQPTQQLGSESPVITANTVKSAGSEDGKTSSGSFTNLNSYLDANKSLGFGQQVAGRVAGTVDSADQAQQQADQGFRSQADAATVKKDDNILQGVKTDATSIANDDAKRASYEKMRDARYAGPQNLVDTDLYEPASSATEKAWSTATQTKDEGGRKAYLNQEYGAGAGRYGYTAGQQKLDNLLIQQDPDSKKAFEDSWQKAGKTKDNFGALTSSLNQYAQQRAGETADTRNAARGTLGIDDAGNWLGLDQERGNAGALQDLVEGVDERVGQQKTAQDAKYGTVEQALKDRKLTPELAAELGIGGQKLWNLDPASFLKKSVDPSRSASISSDEKAKLLALSRLAGKDQSFIDEKATAYDPGKQYDFDKQTLQGQASGQEAEYKDALANLKFLDDIGGGATRSILSGGGTDAEKLAKLQDFSRNSNRPITHDDFGWNNPAKGLEEYLNQYNDPNNQWMFQQGSYNNAPAMNYKRDTANQIFELLKKVKGFNNTI